jgi:hypothetical protein
MPWLLAKTFVEKAAKVATASPNATLRVIFVIDISSSF